jgi:anti-sigma regulatory factor (Ser/Thr protein kinase)
VTDHQEIEQMLGPEIMQTGIETRKDLPRARRRLSEGARSQGMDHHQIDMMLTAVGEATSNVLKHAGGGRLSLHRIDDTLMCVVRDHGPGIQALNLPSVALMPGYSTVGTLGMGYKLMIATSDKVYLATGQGGTTLAMQFTISEEAMARRRGDFVTW